MNEKCSIQLVFNLLRMSNLFVTLASYTQNRYELSAEIKNGVTLCPAAGHLKLKF